MAVFKEIYQQYAPKVYRYLRTLADSDEEAEELLTQTFYQAFLHIDGFEGRSSIYTWLCRIGKNAWIKEQRRKARFDQREIGELEIRDKSRSPEQQVIDREEYQRMLQAVYRLQEPYREVFILHVFGKRQLKEIAALHSKSEEWARVTYYRARNKIAKSLEDV